MKEASELYHFKTNGQRAAANDSLFQFLSGYRISPAGWGFGEPRTTSGYTSSPRWWLDAAGNMVRQNQNGFATMRIPISNQRVNAASRIAGLSPFAPESWCAYLQSVRNFWGEHGWLTDHVPYLYALDEPSLAGMGLVGRQAASAHSCFPGAKVLVTGNPMPSNRFLWDNEDGDDVDIWAVLSRRWYGQFNAPRGRLASIQKVRRAGKSAWSYTFHGVAGTPGYALTEPLSDPRVFLLWNALEGIPGTLYGQGVTSYHSDDVFNSLQQHGEFVLVYPGEHTPDRERAPRTDPGRDRGLGPLRHRPPPLRPDDGATDPRRRRTLQHDRLPARSSPAPRAASSTAARSTRGPSGRTTPRPQRRSRPRTCGRCD